MLLELSEILKNKKIILGSCIFISFSYFVLLESKPRQQLLENQGIKFEICPSNFEENFNKLLYSDPKKYVTDTCLAKANILKEQLKNNFDILICADTIMVTQQGKIIEKPQDAKDAYEMLSQFSNNSHLCHTCIYIALNCQGAMKEIYDIETSEIFFGDIPEIALQKYSQLPDILNKAGGYAIQGLAGSFVKSIRGCVSNIVGLPLHKFCSLLIQIIKENN